jgi:asparagine synthase (glutamine-hydrolysing)
MCGIAGIVSLKGGNVDAGELRAMTRAMAHRGPDGEGEHVSGAIGLGHRRLATLDLGSTGNQPMSFSNGRYWITHNGEIYNFLEIRKVLEDLGHEFRGTSDTEVILAAFAQWGEDCQLRFNGMWAFAIWDSVRRSLFLSRDRFGVKPLFYFRNSQYLTFASEMKAFLALPWFPASFSLSALASTLEDPTALEATEVCLMSGVRRLQAGTSLLAEEGGGLRTHRWWRTSDHLQENTKTFASQVEGFRELFSDAVALRMRSDIRVACTLSGGLDSSAVFSTAAQRRTTTSRDAARRADVPAAYVASYPGTSHDERRHAVSVAGQSGVQPVVVEVSAKGIVDDLDAFFFQCEEGQSPHLGPWLLYREMSRAGIRVSLDGHGGDELLAGYPEHVRFARQQALWPVPNALRGVELTAVLRRTRADSDRRLSLRDWIGAGRVYADLLKARLARRSTSRTAGGRLHPSQFLRVKPAGETDETGELLPAEASDPLTALLYDEFHRRALPTILRDFDRFSMAHGVEVRSPFMDWRLVCYCLSLPSRAVLGDMQTKRVLREAMRGLLPEQVRTRSQKVPYKAPLAEWWSIGLREYVLDTTSSTVFLESDSWDGPALRRLAERPSSERSGEEGLLVLRFVAAARLMDLFRNARARSLVAGSC